MFVHLTSLSQHLARIAYTHIYTVLFTQMFHNTWSNKEKPQDVLCVIKLSLTGIKRTIYYIFLVIIHRFSCLQSHANKLCGKRCTYIFVKCVFVCNIVMYVYIWKRTISMVSRVVIYVCVSNWNIVYHLVY